MGTVIAVIVGIIIVSNWYELSVKSNLPRKIFQDEKDASERLNQIFYKNFIPCVYDMCALHEAYEKGLKKLNDIDLCHYFSYPKEYKLNEKDELIVNDVNLGNAKECCLLQFGYQVEGYDYQINYGIKYNLLKNHFNGRMVVDSYKYNDNWTSMGGQNIINSRESATRLKEIEKCIVKMEDYDSDNMIGLSENAFKQFAYILPEKYKKLYEDFQNNNYTSKEMSEKLDSLYKESNENYYKITENYEKNKKILINDNKERVGKFWARSSSAEMKVYDNIEDYQKNDIYYGSSFKNMSILDKYNGEAKEIEKEYNLR